MCDKDKKKKVYKPRYKKRRPPYDPVLPRGYGIVSKAETHEIIQQQLKGVYYA